MVPLNKTIMYAIGTLFILLNLGVLAFMFNMSSKPVEYLSKDTVVREYSREMKDLEDLFVTVSTSNSFVDTDAKTLLKVLRYSELYRLVIRRDNVPQTKQQVTELVLKLEKDIDDAQTFQMRPILNIVGDIIGVDYKSSI